MIEPFPGFSGVSKPAGRRPSEAFCPRPCSCAGVPFEQLQGRSPPCLPPCDGQLAKGRLPRHRRGQELGPCSSRPLPPLPAPIGARTGPGDVIRTGTTQGWGCISGVLRVGLGVAPEGPRPSIAGGCGQEGQGDCRQAHAAGARTMRPGLRRCSPRPLGGWLTLWLAGPAGAAPTRPRWCRRSPSRRAG